jgi:5-methylcytosine-specific restriction enzyme A
MRKRSPRYESDKRYSDAHKDDADRKFYRTRAWRNHIRPMQLADYPLCRSCKRLGKLVPATTVDHIVPPHGDPGLQRDPQNLQSLCDHHHGLKTRGVMHDKTIGLDGWPIDPNHPANMGGGGV